MAADTPTTAAGTGGTGVTGDSTLSGPVTFWTSYNTVSPEMDTFNNTIVPAFEKLYPNVKVDVQAFPDTDLRQKILTAVAGGQTPDLARADIVQVPEFAELGALAPLDTEMSDFNAIKGTVFDGPLSSNFYKGHYYGLPLDTNTRVLIYNKDLFAKAGITDPPKTFDEMKSDCDKVKALAQADTYCYAEGGTGAWSILPWIWSSGGDITDPTYTKATGYLNSAATVSAITMLKSMLDDKTLSPSILGNGIATSDAIGKAQAATILDGPWMVGIFASQYPDLQIGFAPIPAGPGGSVSVVGGEDIVMFEQSQNKPAAEAFIRYMLSNDPQLALGKVGQMPVLKSLSNNSDLPAYYSTFQTQLATAKARTPSPSWSKIDDAINGAALQALNGEKTPQAAMDEAAATVDGLLAANK
jgi:multiple sugar transport system substrate-binding protein